MFDFLKKTKNNKNTKSSQAQSKPNANIESVAEKTGWSYSEAKDKMKKAKADFGISYKDYNRYDFYTIPENEQKEKYNKILKKIEKNKKAKDKCVSAIKKTNGCSEEEALDIIKEAKERLGISYDLYRRYKFYDIPIEMQEEKYQKVLITEQEKHDCINAIANARDCSKKEATTILKEAKKRLGISYRTYLKYEFYNIPIENQEKTYKEILDAAQARKEKKAKKEIKNENFLKEVISNTGWDYETAKQNMEHSRELCGAEYKDYVAYKFWNLSDDEQKTYFTKGMATALRKKYNTKKENIFCFMNKGKFNEVFTEFLGRKWSYNQDITFDEFKNTFKNEKKIIYKPLSESCGTGVTTFDLTNGYENAYNELLALPIGVVEGFITQHSEMAKFSRQSVNTLRVVTVCDNDKVDILYAAFRMGGGDSVVDNFHSGGVLALLDVTEGNVVTDAIDLNANVYEYHPVTKEKIKGFTVPYWKETVEMLNNAGKIVEGIGYIGWDVAITENGPVLIEGNTAPAPNVLQLPYSLQGKGMAYIVEKYLD